MRFFAKRAAVALVVLMTVTAVLSAMPVFTATLTVESIYDAELGSSVSVGGLTTVNNITVEVYRPDSDEPWVSRECKMEPNGTWFFMLDIPLDAPIGEYTVKLYDYERTFNVIAKKDIEEKLVADESVADEHDETEIAVNEIRGERTDLYIDGRKAGFDAFYADGELMVPMKEFFETMNVKTVHLSEASDIYAVKNEYSYSFKIASAEVEIVNNSIVKIAKMNASVLLVNGNVYVPAFSIVDLFQMRHIYNNGEKIAVISTMERPQWWFKFPNMAEHEVAENVNARVYRGGFSTDMTWGIIQQRNSQDEDSSKALRLHLEGKRVAAVFGTGEGGGCLIGYQSDPPYTEPPHINAWWANDDVFKRIRYFGYMGIHNEVNDELTVKDMGASREELGYSEPKYPNGDSAIGYIEDAVYPFPTNAKVYDMAASRGINDILAVKYEMPYPGDERIDGISVVEVGSVLKPRADGYEEGDDFEFMAFYIAKDWAAPFWKEHNFVAATEMAKAGTDGAWHDNMSPWHNFNGLNNSFGVWSEFTFYEWLNDTFTSEQLRDMGITDINNFDIKEYIMGRATELDAINPADKTDGAYRSHEWLDDPVWCAYKVHKSNIGADFLQSTYKSFKEAYEIAGITDGYCLMGNDMPVTNHGWIEDGWMDQNSSEVNTGWNLSFGSRGIMNPPVGRMSVFYKLAAETCNGPYTTPWLYADEKTKNKEETGKVFLAEGFANGAFIKAAPDGRTVGTVKSYRWLNNFTNDCEIYFGMRYPLYDTAVLQSPIEQLGNMAPNDLMGIDGEYQFHMQGVWGWGHMLTDAHIPYRYIPMYNFNTAALEGVKTLIVPNVECMDDYVGDILEAFVKSGGHLIVTGPSGMRYGKDGLMLRRDVPLLNELTGQDVSDAWDMTRQNVNDDETVYVRTVDEGKVTWSADPYGWRYLMDEYDREILMEYMMAMIDGGSDIFDGSELAETVGVNLWVSADSKRVYVDVVNYDVDIYEDVIMPVENAVFTVQLPDMLADKAVDVYLINPDVEGYLTKTESQAENGFVKINTGAFEVYTSVVIIESGADIETADINGTSGEERNTLISETKIISENKNGNVINVENDDSENNEGFSLNRGTVIMIAALALVAVAAVVIFVIFIRKSAAKKENGND